jgi:hypothetical protein
MAEADEARLVALKRKRAARAGTPGFTANLADIETAIRELEGDGEDA